MTEIYDPEHWMESVTRCLKAYTLENVNTRVFDVTMEFPGSIVDSEKMPLKKTLIHFELDAIDTKPVGFGDNMYAENYNAADQVIQPQYASKHLLTFDVGIWASDRSGGGTSRMRARQRLEFLFGMNGAGTTRFREFTDGGDGPVDVISFTGGRFIVDTSAHDFRLYRMIDCMLELRVFSRTPLGDEFPTIEDIEQAPGLTIIG